MNYHTPKRPHFETFCPHFASYFPNFVLIGGPRAPPGPLLCCAYGQKTDTITILALDKCFEFVQDDDTNDEENQLERNSRNKYLIAT